MLLVLGAVQLQAQDKRVVKELSSARYQGRGKSAAQVIIRWHIQENIEVFDFELTPEEMAKMASLNQDKGYEIWD